MALPFTAEANAQESALRLRQRDVRNTDWRVSVNGRALGALIREQAELVQVFAIPTGLLRSGGNTFELHGNPKNREVDDIEVRDICIEPLPAKSLLTQATVEIRVEAPGGPMPSRITVVDDRAAFAPFVTLRAGAHEAVRTGVLYTADGQARLGLAAGRYRVYASRGFQYNAPSQAVTVADGGSATVHLKLKKEVPLDGYVSCDTHVHTLEMSGHGDASVDERVLTVAGEGLDLAIVTEHNRRVDYAEAVRKRALERWFVAIPGSEFTTVLGHFNIFPVREGAPYPDPRQSDWAKLMDSASGTDGVRVVIQNHPRDLHSGYRPFDGTRHLATVGENLEGRPLRANAMEVVNSAAMASDPLRLVHDWLGLLTRGAPVAAIGSSDTHTVAFAQIGQARTYIDVRGMSTGWRDNLDGVMERLAGGRNLVSFGLAAELRQAGTVKGPGPQRSVPMEVSVWGPSWSSAEEVTVYSNGIPVWKKKLTSGTTGGRKYGAVVDIPLPGHDATLVAVATGPGVLEPFWDVLQPAQPTSDEWRPMVLGISSAIGVDADGDGRSEAPLAYARRLLAAHPDTGALVSALAAYDSAVAAHVVNLLRVAGRDITAPAVRAAFEGGSPAARNGYRVLLEEWRQAAPRDGLRGQ